MNFSVPTIADIQKIRHLMRDNTKDSCEMSPANTVLWAKWYHTKIGYFNNQIIYRSQRQDGGYSYSCNFLDSPDPAALMGCILQQAKEDNCKVRMHCITEAEWQLIEQCYPNCFMYTQDEEGYDYVYLRESLETLSGKKLHAKRNHIHRFEELYPDWSYETISELNAKECRDMVVAWREEKLGVDDQQDEELRMETGLIEYALDHQKELGLIGGALRVEGKIVAITLGERLTDDTFVVHFEKAFSTMQGAYPMINREFVRHELGSYTYVNREEDLGIEGLRRAKRSYCPYKMIKKGIVTERA